VQDLEVEEEEVVVQARQGMEQEMEVEEEEMIVAHRSPVEQDRLFSQMM
jgi:hypothetical protein